MEKDDRGVSTLYSLADFVDEDGSRIRKDESYEKNYLIGKYGAIPTLKSIDIIMGGLRMVKKDRTGNRKTREQRKCCRRSMKKRALIERKNNLWIQWT